MDQKQDAIRAFWDYLKTHKSDFETLETAEDATYLGALKMLHDIEPEVFIEFAVESKHCELIITAEGNTELFPVVEHIVKAAPPLENWKVFALKPKSGFPETAEWEGLTVVPEHVFFEPLALEDSDELGIRMFVPNLKKSDNEKAHSALLLCLDHALGEREFAEKVAYSDVRNLPKGAQLDRYIPLMELEEYLSWRDNQQD